MTTEKPDKPPLDPSDNRSWSRRNFLSIFIFVSVFAITIALFIFQDKLRSLGDLGYLGVFIVSLAANATIVLPMPSLVIILPLATVLNPLLVGLVAAIAGSLGEMTAYLVGYSGRGIWENNETYQKAVAWLKKWGIWVVFIVSATPLPIDIMGIAAGNLRFPAWQYFVACLPGKIIKYLMLAYAAYWGWEKMINDPVFRENATIAGVAAVTTVILLGLALFLERKTRAK